MTALISKHYDTLYLHLAWPNYGLDVLNITMHTEVVIHSMNADYSMNGQGHCDKVKGQIKVT